jgi:hypothetical protein
MATMFIDHLEALATQSVRINFDCADGKLYLLYPPFEFGADFVTGQISEGNPQSRAAIRLATIVRMTGYK